MSDAFQVRGANAAARFKLTIHRGEGMALLGMSWKRGRPPRDFVGFAIEYREPGGDRFYPLQNRLAFKTLAGAIDPATRSSLLSPIQKFRWVHFPRRAELAGAFTYRVTPVFMDPEGKLAYGEPQLAAIALHRDTHAGAVDVAFTRGFVSSQAFVDRFAQNGSLATLLPANAHAAPTFVPTHPRAAEALAWMGFEARVALFELLDAAIADAAAQVRVIAYDLNEPGVLARLEQLGPRLRILIDDDGPHAAAGSPESRAAARLATTAGPANVRRQHMGKLQHNKTVVVDGPGVRAVLCGSTNFTWRGLYVQSNHAVVLRGARPVAVFGGAFEHYWQHGTPTAFGATASSDWQTLGLNGIDARATFSPHAAGNAVLDEVAADVRRTRSSLLYSLAFLYQTPGAMRDAIRAVTDDDARFVYGVSDRKVGGGLDVQKPGGNVVPVFPAELAGDAPEPFRSEPAGGAGNRMHHKFVVIDFDRPTARVWFGSYNFSATADRKNGENLLLVQDRRIATAFMIESLRLFDHYHFRVAQKESAQRRRELFLERPPAAGADPWWLPHYTDPRKARDRVLFSR